MATLYAPTKLCADESETLSELIAGVAAGDEAPFVRLYDATAGRVYGMAVRVVRDQGHAEDITQEVFAEVWNKARQFDPARGTALGWLLTLAHRRAIDRVRSEQSRRDRENQCLTMEVRRSYDDPVSDSVIAKDSGERVQANLDDLTHLQRQALQLAYYNGLTYRETAGVLGVSLSTVKQRIRGAMARLAHIVDERSFA
ncbi:ECF RNA polymerase sigma factor SigK [Antrihabitans stalactiti]|uniref:Sigma-70 family RNA polymerase sigma factor n=1 Tax=Antrihabitans stalactiti TaxID=2584121 RepID=A0A848KAT7_9NOCA|nr:ECF RNA polymerase sigma factor SigK [Antrihabitans stalactiti]NMN95429.1 sigma-70 family RNA polymerase sigma factor [Antrihabitans stalactiti]